MGVADGVVVVQRVVECLPGAVSVEVLVTLSAESLMSLWMRSLDDGASEVWIPRRETLTTPTPGVPYGSHRTFSAVRGGWNG